MAFGKCECCEIYKKQLEYLQGLVDRQMAILAPKPEEPTDPKLLVEDDDVIERIGQG